VIEGLLLTIGTDLDDSARRLSDKFTKYVAYKDSLMQEIDVLQKSIGHTLPEGMQHTFPQAVQRIEHGAEVLYKAYRQCNSTSKSGGRCSVHTIRQACELNDQFQAMSKEPAGRRPGAVYCSLLTPSPFDLPDHPMGRADFLLLHSTIPGSIPVIFQIPQQIV